MDKESINETQVELLEKGSSIVKLENDVQMKVSILRPRDEAAILKSVIAELELYPSCAEEAIYNKPVGKDDRGKMKFAEGLSVRSAESIANRWGNNAYGVEKVDEDGDSVTLAAVFLDYEHNTRRVIQKRVSKSYKKRSGGVVKYSPDRFDIVLSANQSKLIREAVLRSLPAGLKKEYELKAKYLLGNKDKLMTRLNKMKLAFKKLGITEKNLEEIREKKVEDFINEDLIALLGIHNALKEGELTKEELLSSPKDDFSSKKVKESLVNKDQKTEGENPVTNAVNLTPEGWVKINNKYSKELKKQFPLEFNK